MTDQPVQTAETVGAERAVDGTDRGRHLKSFHRRLSHTGPGSVPLHRHTLTAPGDGRPGRLRNKGIPHPFWSGCFREQRAMRTAKAVVEAIDLHLHVADAIRGVAAVRQMYRGAQLAHTRIELSEKRARRLARDMQQQRGSHECAPKAGVGSKAVGAKVPGPIHAPNDQRIIHRHGDGPGISKVGVARHEFDRTKYVHLGQDIRLCLGAPTTTVRSSSAHSGHPPVTSPPIDSTQSGR